MPNQLNNFGKAARYREGISLLRLGYELDKNANSDSDSVGIRDYFSTELVWRLSEFAFLGAQTSVGALFTYRTFCGQPFSKGGHNMKQRIRILLFFWQCSWY